MLVNIREGRTREGIRKESKGRGTMQKKIKKKKNTKRQEGT